MSKTEKQNGGFLAVAQSLQRGHSLEELDEALCSLVQKVTQTGKGGSMTYTIKVKPAKRGSSTLVVEDDVAQKDPKQERELSIWFADKNGILSRTDPGQSELSFTVDDGGHSEQLEDDKDEAINQ